MTSLSTGDWQPHYYVDPQAPGIATVTKLERNLSMLVVIGFGAMAGVGLGTRITELLRIGFKPLGLALVSALLAGMVSATLIRALYRPRVTT